MKICRHCTITHTVQTIHYAVFSCKHSTKIHYSCGPHHHCVLHWQYRHCCCCHSWYASPLQHAHCCLHSFYSQMLEKFSLFFWKIENNALKSSQCRTHWIKTEMYASWMLKPFCKQHCTRIECVHSQTCTGAYHTLLYLRTFFIERRCSYVVPNSKMDTHTKRNLSHSFMQ